MCRRTHGVKEVDARSACLRTIVEQLQRDEVGRLVLESRQDDREDVRLIERVRSTRAETRVRASDGRRKNRCSGSPTRSPGLPAPEASGANSSSRSLAATSTLPRNAENPAPLPSGRQPGPLPTGTRPRHLQVCADRTPFARRFLQTRMSPGSHNHLAVSLAPPRLYFTGLKTLCARSSMASCDADSPHHDSLDG